MTSQALNRPVDVLLNIRAVADVFAAQGAQRSADDLYATADAVAELIDALQMYVAVCGNTGYAFSRQSAQELHAKGSAALAAIGSAK